MAPRRFGFLGFLGVLGVGVLGIGSMGCFHRVPLAAGAAGGPGPGADGSAGQTGVAGDPGGASGRGGAPTKDGGTTTSSRGDPAWVTLRHLTNLEYDLTVHDLVGVDGQARAAFQPDTVNPDTSTPFAVIAGPEDVNDARYEQWFDEADRLATAAFADPTMRARIVTCHPATPDDQTCVRALIGAFGLRAWRRPLTGDEVNSLATLATATLAESGATFEDAIQRVVTAFLSSAPFLYRMEIDPDPTSLVPRALTPYELASRLSYLVWSSMPDDQLLALAANATLLRDDVLRDQVGRLVDDPRSQGFVEAFGGAWLGKAELDQHQVENVPDSASLRGAMGQEMLLYISEFLHTDHSFATFLGSDFNFINGALADIYGVPSTGLGTTLVRTVTTTDQRRGYLGLAGTLTVTSAGTRTSPTKRGQWILGQLLCAPPPAPPPSTPDHISQTELRDGRMVTDAIRAQSASCAACHASMDGLGLALEQFDELGRFRATSPDAAPADGRGTLPDGTAVVGEPALADALAADPRFLTCTARQTMRYALNRELDADDEARLPAFVATWKQGGPTLRALLEQIVLDDTFRFRRGEGPP